MNPQTHQSSITESDILTSYLLTPSSLSVFLPYNAFLSLIPPAQRAKPDCKTLYTDLRVQRNIQIDSVQFNIDRECSRKSTALRTKLVREVRKEMGSRKKRKRDDTYDNNDGDDDDDDDEEDEIVNYPSGERAYDPLKNPEMEQAFDKSLFGHRGLANPDTGVRYHDGGSLLAEMQQAVRDLETQIEEIDRDNVTRLGEMKETVGALSDLRYGRFAKTAAEGDVLEEEVLNSLEELKKVCQQKT